jgi:hypothetical protein
MGWIDHPVASKPHGQPIALDSLSIAPGSAFMGSIITNDAADSAWGARQLTWV